MLLILPYLNEKFLARVQKRKGPNYYWNFWNITTIVDGLKLLIERKYNSLILQIKLIFILSSNIYFFFKFIKVFQLYLFSESTLFIKY